MNLDKLLLKIEKSRIANKPFVIYKNPDASIIKALFPNKKDLTYLKDLTELGFVFAPFDNKEKTVIFPIAECEIISIDTPDNLAIDKKDLNDLLNNGKSREDHLSLVKKGIDFLIKNNLKKVVLSRKEEIEIDHFDMSHLFKNLLVNYPRAFIYIWFHPDVGIWAGASPETLVKVHGNHFETMALAGTQNYKGTLDVTWNNKEKQEQQFVTDFIVSQLKEFDIKISEPFSKRAGNLIHICTEIQGSSFSANELGKLINILHPTPAVCGLPKKVAKEFIIRNENYHREFYTGFLGDLNINNRSDLFVNLRCMQINLDLSSNRSTKVNLYMGGGITVSSNPEKEWEETVSKSQVMKKVLLTKG